MAILGTSLFFTGFGEPVDALPLRIRRLASQPYESAHTHGWGAALMLILIVLLFSVTLRYLAARKGFNVEAVQDHVGVGFIYIVYVAKMKTIYVILLTCIN
jgi:phosphate transport system permease protein